MNNQELIALMVGAAQNKNFDELISIIEEHEPDFNDSAFLLKNIVNVGGVLLSYAADSAPISTVARLLELGICPNNNLMKYYNAVPINNTSVIQNSDYGGRKDSRALHNSIVKKRLDVCSLLINHNCNCCGAGAPITSNLLKTALKSSRPIYELLANH